MRFRKAASLFDAICYVLFNQYFNHNKHNTDSISKYPAGIYLLKVNNRNTRARFEICSKLTLKAPDRRHWGRSGVFIINFAILHFALLLL